MTVNGALQFMLASLSNSDQNTPVEREVLSSVQSEIPE